MIICYLLPVSCLRTKWLEMVLVMLLWWLFRSWLLHLTALKEDRTLPSEGLTLLYEQDQRSSSGQGVGICFFQEEFQLGYYPSYCLFFINSRNEDDQRLHQVKAHVSALAASKAFQGGVPLDQIPSADPRLTGPLVDLYIVYTVYSVFYFSRMVSSFLL